MPLSQPIEKPGQVDMLNAGRKLEKREERRESCSFSTSPARVQLVNVDPTLAAIRTALKSTFPGSGLTYLLVPHGDGWAGGTHRGGGVFGGR